MRQTTAVLLFGPIGIALVWLILGYAWASLMQGGQISARTRRWLFNGCWVMFVGAYAVMIIIGLVQHKF